MNSRHLLCTLISVLAAMILTGCVSQDEYDAVIKERDASNTQLLTLQDDIGVLEVKHDNLKSSVEKTTARLEKEIRALSRISAFFIEAESSLGDQNKMITTGAVFIADMSKNIAEIENAELTGVWSEMLRVAAMNDVKSIGQKLTEILNIVTSLVNDDIARLQSICN